MCCLSWLGMVCAPNHPPSPAPPPAPAPPLLCQPSKGRERRHPAAPAATACAFRETGAGLSAGFYLFILFKGRVSHCTPWTRVESDPARPGRILDERERISPDAGAFPATSLRGHSLRAVPGAWRAAAALETTQGPQGLGDVGAMIKKLYPTQCAALNVMVCCPWRPIL